MTAPAPVFIVAQYKCGTSWLLSALAAHPEILALREIDVIRAACADMGRRYEAADPEHRLQWFFGKTAWCSREAYERVLTSDEPGAGATDRDVPQNVWHVRPAVLRRLREVVADPHADVSMVLDSFLEAAASPARGERFLVLKAADQVRVHRTLRTWQPHAPLLAITRDGRDASLSAMAYRRLMAERRAPWFGGEKDYWTLLSAWAGAARAALALAEAGDVHLVRYEDLTADFELTFGATLRALGADADPAVVESIRRKTDFEAVTGRRRGEEAKAVLRSGRVGEWRDALDADAQARAWEEVGDVLQALGYAQDGGVAPLDRSSWAPLTWGRDTEQP